MILYLTKRTATVHFFVLTKSEHDLIIISNITIIPAFFGYFLINIMFFNENNVVVVDIK